MTTLRINMGSRGHSLGAHVEAVLRERIHEGIYAPGSLLPGRRTLCSELDIAPTTLEKAIKSLLADGTLRTETRRGTFVSDTLAPIGTPVRTVDAPTPRRVTTSAGYRIGIVDTVTDLPMMDPRKNWFEYMIVHAAEDRLSAVGNQTVYRSSRLPDKDGVMVNGAIDEFGRTSVDAVIIVAYHDKQMAVEQELARAKELHIPAVVISTTSREWPVAHVWTDGRLAGRQAGEHLIDGGHQRIAFIAPYAFEWQEMRIQGVLDAMRQAGLSEDHLCVFRPEGIAESRYVEYEGLADVARSLFRQAIEADKEFTAVIGANDWTSVGVLEAMLALGITPGQEMALVSFDDSLVARKHDISSVRFPLEQLGAEAADLAIRAASGDCTQHRLRIGCRVIARASSARTTMSGTDRAGSKKPLGAL